MTKQTIYPQMNHLPEPMHQQLPRPGLSLAFMNKKEKVKCCTKTQWPKGYFWKSLSSMSERWTRCHCQNSRFTKPSWHHYSLERFEKQPSRWLRLHQKKGQLHSDGCQNEDKSRGTRKNIVSLHKKNSIQQGSVISGGLPQSMAKQTNWRENTMTQERL